MSTRRIKRCFAAFLFLAAAAVIGWIAVAGPVTVYRTVVYNFSGIDDYRIFPQGGKEGGKEAKRDGQRGTLIKI